MEVKAVPIMRMPPPAIVFLKNAPAETWPLARLDAAIEVCSTAHDNCRGCQAVSECISLYDKYVDRLYNDFFREGKGYATRFER